MSVLKRDPAFIENTLRPWRPFLRHIFRVEIHGLQDIPSEPCVFISNHNIGAAIEITALLDGWHAHFKERPVYGLAHPFAFRIPGFRHIISKLGGTPATYKAAFEVLNSGASLVVFPGGNWESVRPFSQRHLCDFGGHFGWAKIALQAKRRVVPISIHGSHSLNPVLFRSRWLASLLVIPRLMGLKHFPVTVSQLLYSAFVFVLSRHFLPPGVSAALSLFTFIMTPLNPIWPGKIRIRFGKPVDLQTITAALSLEEERIKLSYARISADIQEGIDRLRVKK